MESLKQYRGARVFVGMSGGVDSSVTAALLQEAGADVTGVFIQGWYPPELPCTWRDDRRDAMRVAAHLGLPFRTLDASVEYKAGVIDYLIAEYRAGRTPNPDIMCNREVKFGAFRRFAKEQGAEWIATGHYARIEREGAVARLHRGSDESKDQSYFLWNVPQASLADAIFPLGDLTKKEVRTLATRFSLPNAAKKDSQGICFLGSISVYDFLKTEFGVSPGEAQNPAGTVVGTHDGALLHTLGERVALAGSAPGPWYVLAKDLRKNVLIVAHERELPEPPAEIRLEDANWFSGTPQAVVAQYRYHGPRVPGRVDENRFIPDTPLLEPVAAGQSLVAYRGDECLGGAIIA